MYIRQSKTIIWHQARRQKFSEGGSFDTAGGLGAAQGSQKPLGFWCKILQSSNFQTLQTFGKLCFPLLIFKDFHQILHQLGLWYSQFKQNVDFNSVNSFQRGVRTNPSNPPPPATGVDMLAWFFYKAMQLISRHNHSTSQMFKLMVCQSKKSGFLLQWSWLRYMIKDRQVTSP